jgi:hypothetical protein
MNASRRIARKYQVRTVTERMARKEMAGDPRPKTVKRRLTALLDKVHQFLCNAPHKLISGQAVKLGIIQQSPRSEHHKRTGIATR